MNIGIIFQIQRFKYLDSFYEITPVLDMLFINVFPKIFEIRRKNILMPKNII